MTRMPMIVGPIVPPIAPTVGGEKVMPSGDIQDVAGGREVVAALARRGRAHR